MIMIVFLQLRQYQTFCTVVKCVPCHYQRLPNGYGVFIKRKRESHICCPSRSLRPTTAHPCGTSNADLTPI